MDWIKKNYDKLLLGLFGIFALVIGGMLCADTFAAADEDTKTNKVTERSELGPDKSEETKKALTDLSANVGKPVWTALKIAEHRSAHLFTASPVVQKAGTDGVLQLLDETIEVIRPSIPNWWLYENGLDITRDDVASLDDDGDKFTNAEEFEGKSNPRDPDSRPAFYAKLRFMELVEVKYEIRNRGIEGNDISITRLTPLFKDRAPSKLDFHVNDILFEDDKRFTIKGVKDIEKDVAGQKQMVPHVILQDDDKHGKKEYAIGVRETLNLPTYEAKIKSMLSGKEANYKEGEEFTLPDFPGIKVTIEKIIPPDTVEISWTEPGQPKRKAQLKLTK